MRREPSSQILSPEGEVVHSSMNARPNKVVAADSALVEGEDFAPIGPLVHAPHDEHRAHPQLHSVHCTRLESAGVPRLSPYTYKMEVDDLALCRKKKKIDKGVIFSDFGDVILYY
jgi:hypothetical protein